MIILVLVILALIILVLVTLAPVFPAQRPEPLQKIFTGNLFPCRQTCLLYTSDAADEL